MAASQRISIPAELRSLFPTRWLNAAARESLLWRRVSIRDAAAGTFVLAALYLPLWARGETALRSVPEVVRRFRFNGPAFEAVASASSRVIAAASRSASASPSPRGRARA